MYNLTPDLKKRYCQDKMSAREAQRLAEFIAFGPIVFQTARVMLRKGILEALRDADNGLTIEEVSAKADLSHYAAQCLLEASLSIGIVYLDPENERFKLTKTGWFIVTDPAVNVNFDFNHDVNYLGWHKLDAALDEGRPAGLPVLGPWPTIYEGLSKLPESIRRSWLAFDHFYSDNSFDRALEIVFSRPTKTLLDVGGNTGRWASRCVKHTPDVTVTILDLPGQIEMMLKATSQLAESDRIKGYGMDLLDPEAQFPDDRFDAIWMSQFLDCFSAGQVIDILSKARRSMDKNSRLYIMETLWDRQRFEPAAMCLTLTSLYFTTLANGNSKMFRSDDLFDMIRRAGLAVEDIKNNLGQGHSVITCKLANN